jgi:hypothetical protein
MHGCFNREPVSWELYNKLLSRRDNRNFKTRTRNRRYWDAMVTTNDRRCSAPPGDRVHDACALSVFFLSDGAPSDARRKQMVCSTATNVQKIGDIALHVMGTTQRLHWSRFGNAHDVFSSRAMAEAVRRAGDARLFCILRY